MTRKQIDASREVRLWIGTLCGIVFTVASIPGLRDKAEEKIIATRDKVRDLFNKKGKANETSCDSTVTGRGYVDTTVFDHLKTKYKQSHGES